MTELEPLPEPEAAPAPPRHPFPRPRPFRPRRLAQLKADVQEQADRGIGLLPFIPQVDLLRIGYLF